MSRGLAAGLRNLDQCLTDRASLASFRSFLEKVEKCCSAIDKKINLADVLRDEANYRLLSKALGEGEEVGFQLILKLALKEYIVRSFSIGNGIEEKQKIEFLFQSLTGWQNQFDTVLTLQGRTFVVLNPQNLSHREAVEGIAPGSLITVYIKALKGNRSSNQETLAIERFAAVLNQVQSKGSSFNHPEISLGFQVMISKTDTFVHAGNAQLIVSHLTDYPGRVEMFVLRDQRVPVPLDADSIWGTEIRNGETVLFEFYGPKPSSQFVKDLAIKTNRYTQMDKVS